MIVGIFIERMQTSTETIELAYLGLGKKKLRNVSNETDWNQTVSFTYAKVMSLRRFHWLESKGVK